MDNTMAEIGNFTLISSQNGTLVDEKVDYSSKNALLYIVCVLMFYAFSIVVLMIKYVRREKEEADQRNFFNEFIKREKFCSPQYQNTLLMEKLLKQENLKFICQTCPPIPGKSHRPSKQQDSQSEQSCGSNDIESQSDPSQEFGRIESQSESDQSSGSDVFHSQSDDGMNYPSMNYQLPKMQGSSVKGAQTSEFVT